MNGIDQSGWLLEETVDNFLKYEKLLQDKYGDNYKLDREVLEEHEYNKLKGTLNLIKRLMKDIDERKDEDVIFRAKVLVDAKKLLDKLQKALEEKYGEDFEVSLRTLTPEELSTYRTLVNIIFEMMGGVTRVEDKSS